LLLVILQRSFTVVDFNTAVVGVFASDCIVVVVVSKLPSVIKVSLEEVLVNSL
jgi:hypothetical protein